MSEPTRRRLSSWEVGVCFYVLPTIAKKPMRPEMLLLIEEGARIQRDPRKFATFQRDNSERRF